MDRIMAKRKPTPDVPAEPPSANYTVLARRYRPQQFADLVGQEPVAQALANALQSQRVAHAYLFTGARGVGKTSTARILAKALNCVNGPTTTPCGECDLCRAIAAGEDVDVLEIDGASNRGIDEVRDIRMNVQYRPQRARYKIYIIDEVHMLTTPAFNALLKTLEEPPPHVKFIFATTEAHKIPVTILSRCQRFDFGGISLPRIVERLRQIVAAEGTTADDEALELVARRAGGSMRDAQSLLDQLLAFGGGRLTVETVHQLLGTAHEERVASLADAVLHRDAKRALALLAEMLDQGQQLGELLDQLIEYWRDLMVVHCAGLEGQGLSVTGGQRDALKERAAALKLDTIVASLDILVGAKSRMRHTGHGRVLFEMALVRLVQLEDLVPLSQLASWVSGAAAPTPPNRAANAANPSRPALSSGPQPAVEKKKLTPGADEPTVAAPLRFDENSLALLWQEVLASVGLAMASDLRKVVSLAISGPNTLVLRVPQRYNVPGTAGFDPARVARVEEALGQLTGQARSVRLEFIKDERNEPAAAPSVSETRRRREALKQLPLVQTAREMLGAEIVGFDAEFGSSPTPTPAAPAEAEED